ncbi:MAG: acyl dehydratase [Deltaproteobacteria bacterium]|nr:acyl dehydratase [Deltaproteobacteria bacterium]MBW2691780.1 acyl dehydratase [Deltaproteobacteria bacterium]
MDQNRNPDAAVRIITVEAPYFEDLKVGQLYTDAPSVTLTAGHMAFHEALFGDRLRLPLDETLCEKVTGSARALVHPNVVCNVAIGQTTSPTQRVKGNLFYRGLVLHQPVFVGDTLRTSTKIVALKQNRAKPGRDATGMAVLEIHVDNQRSETVLHFWRCAMIPCRDPNVATGANDSFDTIPAELDMQQVEAAVPVGWQLDHFRRKTPGGHFEELDEGSRYVIEARDSVTSAPELARLTLNVAKAHTDAASSPYGKRLVYGGHTISMASAQITRALPNLVTLVAWRSCDHTEPVFEGDVLHTEFSIDAKHPLSIGGGLIDLRAVVHATRGDQAQTPGAEATVLDWRVIGLMA